MKHMVLDDWCRMESLAACGCSADEIAADWGRSPSTIRDEFQNRRVSSDKGALGEVVHADQSISLPSHSNNDESHDAA